MNAGYLSEHFVGVAAKRLKAVEADPGRSNQHEFNGVSQLKRILGTERHTYPARFLYLGLDEEENIQSDGFVTWYDAREDHPRRSEYRLYFNRTEVSQLALADDLVIFGRRPDDSLLVIVVASGSTVESQLIWLFDLSDDLGLFQIRENWTNRELDLAARTILEELGIETPLEDEDYLGVLLDRFGNQFPSTREFSDFARDLNPSLSSLDDPDAALLTWIEREEMLFRTLEAHIVKERLKEGFEDDVDGFVSYSLSVQNRRKSRVGYAFENHLEYIFEEHDLSFDRGAKTENRSRPDFLFPGIEAYRDPAFPVESLTMLAAKSTCKDRWRQILSEASRLDERHLITLEPGISRNQTDEMSDHRVQLVVPRDIQRTYSENQELWLFSISDFIEKVGM